MVMVEATWSPSVGVSWPLILVEREDAAVATGGDPYADQRNAPPESCPVRGKVEGR